MKHPSSNKGLERDLLLIILCEIKHCGYARKCQDFSGMLKELHIGENSMILGFSLASDKKEMKQLPQKS